MAGAWRRLMRARRRWLVLAAGLAAAVLAGSAVLVVRHVRADDGPTTGLDIAVVGDSFAVQSRDAIRELAAGRGLRAEVTAYDGTALCTFEPQFEDLAVRRPGVLVLAFAGNDLQPCINTTCSQQGGDPLLECRPRDGTELAADYRADLEELLTRWRDVGADIYVVSPPPIADPRAAERAAAMRVMYADLVADHPEVGLIDPSTRLDPEGRGFVERLPCEDYDTCDPDGTVLVRQPDGIHLTPAGGQRYARALFDEIDP
jgi:SGNH domain-containing protein